MSLLLNSTLIGWPFTAVPTDVLSSKVAEEDSRSGNSAVVVLFIFSVKGMSSLPSYSSSSASSMGVDKKEEVIPSCG